MFKGTIVVITDEDVRVDKKELHMADFVIDARNGREAVIKNRWGKTGPIARTENGEVHLHGDPMKYRAEDMVDPEDELLNETMKNVTAINGWGKTR